MKKLLAVILTLVMMLSCMNVMGEDMESLNKMTLYSAIDIHSDMLMQLLPLLTGTEANENTQSIIDAALSIINELVFSAALDAEQKAAQVDIYLKDTPVATLVGKTEGNELVCYSNLYPTYVLKADASALSEMQGALTAVGSAGMALGALPEELENALAEVLNSIEITQGEMEIGEYTIEGALFNMRAPMHLPVGKLAEALEKLLTVMSQDEQLGQMIPQDELKDIQEAIAGMTEDEKNAEAVEIMMYTAVDEDGNVSDDLYFTVEVPQEEAGVTVSLAAGVVDGILHAHLLGSSQPYETEEQLRQAASIGEDAVTLDIAAVGMEDGFQIGLDLLASGLYLRVMEQAGIDEESLYSVTDLYFMTDSAPLLTISIQLIPGQAMIDDQTDLTQKTVLRLEDMTEGEDSEALNALLQDLQTNGLAVLMQNASAAMPEEVNALLSVLMPVQAAPVE